MKRTIVLFSFCLAIIGLTSCHKHRLRGEGPEKTEHRALANFNEIDADGSTGITVVKDSTYFAEVIGYANLLSFYETRVKDGRLILKYRDRFWNIRNDNVRVIVHTPYVDQVNLNGSGNVEVHPGFDQDRLNIDVNGSGDINVSGCKYFVTDLKVNGSGSINTENSVTEKVYAHISGSGNMYVNVNQYLEVNISGSGDVYYRGNPSELKINTSGSGKVQKR